MACKNMKNEIIDTITNGILENLRCFDLTRKDMSEIIMRLARNNHDIIMIPSRRSAEVNTAENGRQLDGQA